MVLAMLAAAPWIPKAMVVGMARLMVALGSERLEWNDLQVLIGAPTNWRLGS